MSARSCNAPQIGNALQGHRGAIGRDRWRALVRSWPRHWRRAAVHRVASHRRRHRRRHRRGLRHRRASLLGVAGGEFLIPTLALLFGADIKLAGSLSLAVSLPTMLVGLARYSRDQSRAPAELAFLVSDGRRLSGRDVPRRAIARHRTDLHSFASTGGRAGPLGSKGVAASIAPNVAETAWRETPCTVHCGPLGGKNKR